MTPTTLQSLCARALELAADERQQRYDEWKAICESGDRRPDPRGPMYQAGNADAIPYVIDWLRSRAAEVAK